MNGYQKGLGTAQNIPPIDADTRFTNETDAFIELLRLAGLKAHIRKGERNLVVQNR